MNLLVLGASSVIGSEIAVAFARGNWLLLVGRDPQRLGDTAVRCRNAGAERTLELPCDLATGIAEVARVALEWGVTVVVNAASATSRLRDNQIPIERLQEYFSVEVSAPLELVRTVATGSKDPVRVIYISSILAVLPTPNRRIYGSLKGIHERALSALTASTPRLRSQIFRVATIVNPDVRTAKAQSLGCEVKRAFEAERTVVTYGLAGRLLWAVYATQPLLGHLLIRGSRLVRKRGTSDD